MSETYPLTFYDIGVPGGSGSSFSANIYFNGSEIASGTKLDMIIYAPSTISTVNYVGFDDEYTKYHSFVEPTDFEHSGNTITIHTTVANINISSIVVGIVYDGDAGTQGGYSFNNLTLTNGKIVGDFGNWRLTSSVGKVIKKTNDIKQDNNQYGWYSVTGRIQGVRSFLTDVGHSEYSYTNTSTQFSGANLIDLGTYPTYNLINNSSGLGPTMPSGGAEPGVNNWIPKYSPTEYNPLTGSAIVDVSSQDKAIQLYYKADWTGNSWHNGAVVAFFVKTSKNYYDASCPIDYIGINVESRSITPDSNTDAGVVTFNAPDISKTYFSWGSSQWCEYVFVIKDLSTLPSRDISGIGFNITLSKSNAIQYFSDPGFYPMTAVNTNQPGFYIPTIG